MMLAILRLLSLILTTLRLRSELALENLALRQQLAVLNRRHRRPKLRKLDRFFWLLLSRSWERWKETLIIVKPETVLRWHRRRFASYWTRLSRQDGPGRPGKDREIRELIRKMAKSNPLWGAPRVHGELLKLGIDISERTVSRWMPRRRKPPSQNWRVFLDNHVGELMSIDFFTVPTATFRVLFVLIVLAHDRRRIVHFNVTEHRTAEWTGQQMVEAFCDGKSPRYLMRDRNGMYGLAFRDRVKALDIEEVVIAPHSPWQNPYVERVIGTLRRECLDHVVVLGETHLSRIVRRYVNYYHGSRTHLALDKDAPEPRSVQPPERGRVIEMPEVGGLHHRYERRAA
jgi:transposase InsO family protein